MKQYYESKLSSVHFRDNLIFFSLQNSLFFVFGFAYPLCFGYLFIYKIALFINTFDKLKCLFGCLFPEGFNFEFPWFPILNLQPETINQDLKYKWEEALIDILFCSISWGHFCWVLNWAIDKLYKLVPSDHNIIRANSIHLKILRKQKLDGL